MIPAQIRTPLDGRPLAREGAVAALLFGGFLLWMEALRGVGTLVVDATDPLVTVDTPLGDLAATALIHGVVVVLGMVAFAVAYTRVRDASLSIEAPGRADLLPVAAAGLVPVGTVGVVYALATLTGTTLSALTHTSLAAGASPLVPAVLAALGLFVGLPAYVLLTHALVQQTLRTAARPAVAIGLTTVLVGVTDPTGLTNSGLPVRMAVVTLLLVAAIALPALAAHSFDSAWLTRLCAVPLALFAGGFVADWAAGLDGPAATAFALSKVTVVAVGAYAYERTDSLVPPALAYATFVIATEAVVLLVEGGVRP